MTMVLCVGRTYVRSIRPEGVLAAMLEESLESVGDCALANSGSTARFAIINSEKVIPRRFILKISLVNLIAEQPTEQLVVHMERTRLAQPHPRF